MTCSPVQSEFLIVTEDEPYTPPVEEATDEPEPQQQMEVLSITYHITNDYANNLYNSCKFVF